MCKGEVHTWCNFLWNQRCWFVCLGQNCLWPRPWRYWRVFVMLFSIKNKQMHESNLRRLPQTMTAAGVNRWCFGDAQLVPRGTQPQVIVSRQSQWTWSLPVFTFAASKAAVLFIYQMAVCRRPPLQPASDAFFRAENEFLVWAHGSWTQATGISCGIWQQG